MNNEELDEVRRLILAFEDVATWCEQLAGLARESIVAGQQNPAANAEKLAGQLAEIERHLQYLEANRRAVGWLRARVGLPAPEPPDRPI